MVELDYDQKIRTYCPSPCILSCGMFAYIKEERVVKIEPAAMAPAGDKHICSKGLSIIQSKIYHPDRLKYPLKRIGERGEGKWQRISWDEALESIAGGLKKTREKDGPKAVMGFHNIPLHTLGYTLAARLADLLECTTGNYATAGDSAGMVANKASFGNLVGGHDSKDAVNSKYLIIWGLNPAETNTVEMRDFLTAQAQGTKLVVIDPRFTATATKADWWIPVRPGTDGALALGMAKVIVDRKLHDTDFLTRFTVAPFLVREDNGLFLREKDIREGGSDTHMCWDRKAGLAKPSQESTLIPGIMDGYDIYGVMCRTAFQRLVDQLQEYTLDRVSEITEVPEKTIERLAIEYATSKPAGIKGFWGLQRGFHGHLSVRAIQLLGALTGNIGIAGGGVSDWRVPLVFENPLVQPVDERRAHFVSLPVMHEMIATGKPYPIKTLFITGSYLTQKADTNRFINDILSKLDLVVVFDIFMTPTAEYADIVLPGATTFESTELNFWPFPYVQLAPKLIEPLYECRSDFWVFKELARRMGLGEYFDVSEEEHIEEIMRSLHLENITVEDLRKGPVKLYEGPEAFVAFADKQFPTPSGRMEFYAENYVKMDEALPVYKEPLESRRGELAKTYPLIFFSTHTRWRWHTNFQNAKWLRELKPEPELEINPRDAEPRGINDGDLVMVFNDRGRCKVKVKLTEGIRPGMVNIEQGWWAKNFLEGSHQNLTHDTINPAQDMVGLANMAFLDVLVDVRKV